MATAGSIIQNVRRAEPKCRRCFVPLTDDNWSRRKGRANGYSCKKCASDDTIRYRAASEWGWLHTLIGNVNSRHVGRVTTSDMRPKYTGKCFWCGRSLISVVGDGRMFGGSGRTIDHLVPVSRGGRTEPSNLEFACWPCNQMKGNLLPDEFLSLMKRILALHGA